MYIQLYPEITNILLDFHVFTLVLYICVNFWLLAHKSHDLSQVETKLLLKAEQIHKMTTIFTQNDGFFKPGNYD